MAINTKILRMLRNRFFLPKGGIFILGLVFSYAWVNIGVVNVLADFLGDNNYDLWKATMLVNFLDGLSPVLKLVVIHVSAAYIGRFMAIFICAAAMTTGLVLLFVRASAPGIVTLIFTLLLIALGTALQPTLKEFFDHQLSEKVKEKRNKKKEGEDKESSEPKETGKEPTSEEFFGHQLSEVVKEKRNKKKEGEDQESSEPKERSDNNDIGITNFWWSTATISGSVCAAIFIGSLPWSKKFELSSIIMGATCLLFILGIFCYYPQEKPSEIPLTSIYRVFKAAIKKRRLSYPSSEQGYYNNEDSDDLPEDLYYRTAKGEVHLLPRHPSFLSFLDRAATTNSDVEEEVGKICTVVQVRDVKSLYPIIPLGVIFFAYSLVSASGNTYFVLQTTNLSSFSIGPFHSPIMLLFASRFLATFVARTIQSRCKLVRPLWSMAVGMICSVLCCIVAWQVEHRRLSQINFLKKPDDNIPISIMILTPQYFLLGLMKGFAEGGLKTFLRDRLYSESMKNFVEPCIEMMLGIGKLSSIIFVLLFHVWIRDDINDSRLDRYFLVLASLASLSFVYLVIYVFCPKSLMFHKPQVVGPETIQEPVEREDELLQVQVVINQ